MHKSLFLIFFLLPQLSIYGQVADNAEVNISVGVRQFFVTIKRSSTEFIVEYKIREKENSVESEKDTATIRLRKEFSELKNINLKNDTVVNLAKGLDSIHLAYTIFRSDTLHLNRNSIPEYEKLFSRLLATPTDTLEKHERIIHLDGISFKFILKDGTNSRAVYAYSIGKENYPQLAEFVAATMSLYRERKNNNFLDRKNTAGY